MPLSPTDWPDFSHLDLPAEVQAHIDYLESRLIEIDDVLVGQNWELVAKHYGLSPQQAKLVAIIARHGRISRPKLHAVLYAGEIDQPGEGVISTTVTHLNKRAGERLRVRTAGRSGLWLEEPHRQEVLALLDQGLARAAA